MFDGTGLWLIFPIIGMACMLLMMSRMWGLWGGGQRREPGMGPRHTGPMGMMDSDRHGEVDDIDRRRGGDEDAMDVLRRRYAAGELNDDEFDAMRRKLEGRS
ncbi:MAG: SHOCT domain-containing protein [Actinomycetia bacterium]|nr:SHOCT domain-containing protein [Actinomycetes bacterium]MCP5035102.1 SHOCT domain-containing protein [Actinomycetes bacterium]